ncbi:Hypothetical protein DEACI_1150 [Acididesulfobacillus acetoxydans]|uniref:Uncharacterized protein conserved in bacteria C-term(DUF2220) n=1 Tax=Acididesulfobacillus acetoxydans TaxID=1561005 RepID=A0A8S0XVP3_9FIRM|nr:hypothetical protein [Acididesulfobacillus acetoxydans]CAA7600497.1 Hypothetical protein DEACI_1150 [Acididesulfobacillus acetoxydans]CEJ06631.1 Uncharacterized protein conserved in bacteria C-term(DUF2220) [Acididesulfobacillus acetoxydans]
MQERSLSGTLLVIENKDTWFTLRRLLRETGKNRLAGTSIQALIYGEGNKITKPEALQNYAQGMFSREILTKGKFLYFGDLDHEGIRLYHRTQKANPALHVCTPLPINIIITHNGSRHLTIAMQIFILQSSFGRLGNPRVSVRGGSQ